MSTDMQVEIPQLLLCYIYQPTFSTQQNKITFVMRLIIQWML